MTTEQHGAAWEPTLLDLPGGPVLPYPDRETGRSSGWSGSETSAERAHTEDANGTTSERQQTVLLWLNLRRSAGATWKELAEAKGWHHGQASGVLSGLHKERRIARLAEERRHRCAVYVLPQWVADRPTVEQGRERRASLLLDQVADVLTEHQPYVDMNNDICCRCDSRPHPEYSTHVLGAMAKEAS